VLGIPSSLPGLKLFWAGGSVRDAERSTTSANGQAWASAGSLQARTSTKRLKPFKVIALELAKSGISGRNSLI
jgi:hypothetical protein